MRSRSGPPEYHSHLSQPLPPHSGSPELPRDFRKRPIEERRRLLQEAVSAQPAAAANSDPESLAWADAMVESAVGFLPVPLGIATGFLIDGARFDIPMAVEEPSVIAAATYAGSLVAKYGGFHTWATDPIMVSQIFLEGVSPQREAEISAARDEIAREIEPMLASMATRGGGFRDVAVERLNELDMVRVDLLIDVRDAMGANLINSAAEQLRALLEKMSGGTALMCILTNEARHRRAGARFELPVSRLKRGAWDGREAARRLVLGSEIARVDPSRAVTHNKGVMNGISALALATGNDTRGIEAAVHRWAARDGHYRGITSYRLEGEVVIGEVELPLPFATTGGAVGFHPSSRTSLSLLGNPDAKTLSRIAAALGLAQNFAAVHALVTEGIQKGHMKMHAARVALLAGARNEEVRGLAERLAAEGSYSLQRAQQLLRELRSEAR